VRENIITSRAADMFNTAALEDYFLEAHFAGLTADLHEIKPAARFHDWARKEKAAPKTNYRSGLFMSSSRYRV
jgi:hypothetical protein